MRFSIREGVRQKALPISSIEMIEEPRIGTDLEEFNRVLGGGIVPGSLILIGGDPGIGKSTLLLQVSSLLANKGQRVLYISGEESIRQTKLRAERLGVKSDELYIYAETDLGLIHETIADVKPQCSLSSTQSRPFIIPKWRQHREVYLKFANVQRS